MIRSIPAIPTSYGGVNFRSRLEAKWAIMFDVMGWAWEYEPVDFRGSIPDFVMRFNCSTIMEAKPAFTVEEIAERRRVLLRQSRDWLLALEVPMLRYVQDNDGDNELDLALIDSLIDNIDRIESDQEPVRGRRALVVGSQLFINPSPDYCTIDGNHAFVFCNGCDFGLVDSRLDVGGCIVCGGMPTALIASSTMLGIWREAGNKAQWKPVG